MNKARRALAYFCPDADSAALAPVPGGNVNLSFRVDIGLDKRYILQRLSPAAFPHPDQIMTNLALVTGHLDASQQGRAGGRLQIPYPVAAPDGNLLYRDDEGAGWRLMTWIGPSRTLTGPVTIRQAREMGRVLGRFHQLLADLDPARLYDPLPGFHHTPTCLAACDQAIQNGDLHDAAEHTCVRFVERFRDRADILEKNRSHLCQTIIHGDPKVANFLFADNRDAALALIDLDTVMPGLLLHDLGDALRSCCNPLGEEGKPERIIFARDLFAAFLNGYVTEGAHLLTKTDLELLVDAPLVIAFELGLRFFTDHINGNTYFRVSRPDQNLDRALVQFHLVAAIAGQRRALLSLVDTLL